MNDTREVIAVIGATIIDGNGGTPARDGVILIEGERIAAVADRSVEIPRNATKISASGKFVIPGLIVPNAYLVDGTDPATTLRYEGRYDELAVEAAQLALRSGITTVFDGWGPPDPLLKAREAIGRGHVTGARIYVCGNWVGIGGPYSEDMRPQNKAAAGNSHASRINSLWEANVGDALARMPLEEVQSEVRKYVRSGVDYITYPVNVHRQGAYQYLTFAPRVQQMIVEEAHHVGLPVLATFATTDEGIRLALEAGVDILCPTPGTGRCMSAETVALISRKAVPCIVTACSSEDEEWLGAKSASGETWWLELLRAKDRDARALIGAGVPILSATWGEVRSADLIDDLKHQLPPNLLAQFGEGHVHGLRALQEKGMSPMAALMAATRNNAMVYKVDKDVGTLERGKLADLVILDKDPLQSTQNYLSVSVVIKEGQIIDRDALPTRRLLTAETGFPACRA